MAKYIIELEDGEVRDENEVAILTEYNWVTKKLTPHEEPEQEKSGRWRGKDYWYVDHLSEIKAGLDGRLQSDNWRYASGNYFKTKEEAEEYKESLIVYNELKAYAEPDNAVWDGENHHWLIYYDYDYADIHVGRVFTMRYQTLYFSSEEAAQAAIEAVGEGRVKRHYLGIKED